MGGMLRGAHILCAVQFTGLVISDSRRGRDPEFRNKAVSADHIKEVCWPEGVCKHHDHLHSIKKTIYIVSGHVLHDHLHGVEKIVHMVTGHVLLKHTAMMSVTVLQSWTAVKIPLVLWCQLYITLARHTSVPVWIRYGTPPQMQHLLSSGARMSLCLTFKRHGNDSASYADTTRI